MEARGWSGADPCSCCGGFYPRQRTTGQRADDHIASTAATSPTQRQNRSRPVSSTPAPVCSMPAPVCDVRSCPHPAPVFNFLLNCTSTAQQSGRAKAFHHPVHLRVGQPAHLSISLRYAGAATVNNAYLFPAVGGSFASGGHGHGNAPYHHVNLTRHPL